MAPEVQDDFEKSIAEAQAAMDRGARFGKSRLAAHPKSPTAGAKRKRKQQAQRVARKAQR